MILLKINIICSHFFYKNLKGWIKAELNDLKNNIIINKYFFFRLEFIK